MGTFHADSTWTSEVPGSQPEPQEPRRVIWRRFYRHGMPLYRATLRGIDYAITQDGAGSLRWRVYAPEGGNGWPFDATFRTLAEAKAAAEQNAFSK